MKLKYLSAEFLLIFLILVLPPLLASPSDAAVPLPQLSWSRIQSLLIAILLKLQLDRELHPRPCQPLQGLSLATVSFGLLMLVYAAIELVLTIIAGISGQAPSIQALAPPLGAGQWLLATAALAIGAFYEECLYRAFLPEISLLILLRLGKKISDRHRKAILRTTEIPCILIFALSHRYLGPLAIVNALLCGTILRICYRKSGGLLCGTAAHFCYNITVLLFSSLPPMPRG